MEGLMLNELKKDNVYRCQISGCKILVTNEYPSPSYNVNGRYFYEGSFRSMDVRDG